jgi:hypothetical protein
MQQNQTKHFISDKTRKVGNFYFIFCKVLLAPEETHIKRQATRHDCLPSLLGDGVHMN